MNIYLITDERNMDEYNWYDSYNSHCIIAENEEQVRKLASEIAGNEGSEMWLNSKLSCVTLISNYTGKEKTPYILISSYNAA